MTTATERHPLKPLLARATVYALLARAFSPRDGESRRALAGGTFLRDVRRALRVLDSGSDVGRALSELRAACHGADAVDREIGRVFAPATAGSCPPYGTEYTGAHVFMRSHQLADVAGFYRAFGLRVASSFHDRPDHICAELEFMHVACLQEARALAQGLAEDAQVCHDAQARFLEEHLGRWLEPYARQVVTAVGDGFYWRLASLAAAFVAEDCARMGVKPELVTSQRREPEPEPPAACAPGGGEADVEL